MISKRPIILAIDDDPNDLLFLVSAFKFIGASASIHTAGGGQEAMDYLDGKGIFDDRGRYPYPGFILTDLKMPGVDGFAVLEFLLKKPESAVIRTVVFSGSQDSDDIKKAYLLGASGYLVKPSSPLELRQIVKTLHDYWLICESPERGRAGEQGPPAICRKLGGPVAAGLFGAQAEEGRQASEHPVA